MGSYSAVCRGHELQEGKERDFHRVETSVIVPFLLLVWYLLMLQLIKSKVAGGGVEAHANQIPEQTVVNPAAS